ncbi:MAG: ComF family protein [Patescibacteria group bacterium]
MMRKNGIGSLILDVLFPKVCFRCKREGSYLCQDCLATLEVLESSFCLCEKPQRLAEAGKCRNCRKKQLDGLYFAISYQNNLVKNLIRQFKYEPYIKELAVPLALLIITHFNLIQKQFPVENYIMIPVPLTKKKMKQRGFNQSEELAKEISENLGIPVVTECLLKIKETPPQMELSAEERMENIKGVFAIKNDEKLKNKKIFLVDDVYTTGSTMEEAAGVLKKYGAKEVWGIVVARGQ